MPLELCISLKELIDQPENDSQRDCSKNGHIEGAQLMYFLKQRTMISTCANCGLIYSRRLNNEEFTRYLNHSG